MRGGYYRGPVGDKCFDMIEAVGEMLPEAKYQRCTVNFYRNLFAATLRPKIKLVTKMLKVIHTQESEKLLERRPELW